jgi:hypothetical protein
MTTEKKKKSPLASNHKGLPKAKSKAQRRLFAMALAHKRGKLPEKYHTNEIKLLSEHFSENDLHSIASTKQLKTKGKNKGDDRIPHKVGDKKKKLKEEDQF